MDKFWYSEMEWEDNFQVAKGGKVRNAALQNLYDLQEEICGITGRERGFSIKS